MTALQTGMIDAYPTTPLLGLTLQWYRQTPNMVGMGMAPLVGGLVMTKPAWAKIAAPDRAQILAACAPARAQARGRGAAPGHHRGGRDEEARAQGERRDAARTPRSSAPTAEEFAAGMKGIRVPPDILELARRERDAYPREARQARTDP